MFYFLFFFGRCDLSFFAFKIGNIFQFSSKYKHGFQLFHVKNYLKTLQMLIKHLKKENNKKRAIENYCIGSTCFAGPAPRFWNEDRVHHSMIPHPFKHSMPDAMAHSILNKACFKDLVTLCADETIKYLHQCLLFCKRHSVKNEEQFIQNVKQTYIRVVVQYLRVHTPFIKEIHIALIDISHYTILLILQQFLVIRYNLFPDLFVTDSW